jgi:putative FmdB family regulatory protein
MHFGARYNPRRYLECKEKEMPVYTYRCEACGVQFEKHQSFHDDPLKTCPECRKRKLKKVITPSKIIFKGSGFYATDHKSPSGAKSHKSKSENKKESEPAEAKTETKSSDVKKE